MASTIRLRRDYESDWIASAATARLKAGEVGLYHADGAGEFLGAIKVGKIVAGNDDATTLADDLTLWSLLSPENKEKLDLLEVITPAVALSLVNAALGTDLENILDANGLTYASIATILDEGTGSDRWRNAAVSIYGQPADADGDLYLADGSAPISAINGLQAELDGKSADGHGHSTGQITGLDAALAAKVAASLLGAVNGVATLDEGGKLNPAQIPAALGNDVTSVHGRTGAVVAVAGDYTATLVGVSAHGFVSTTTSLQAFLNELIDEVVPLSQKGSASGVCPLNSSSKIDSSYLQTADSAHYYSTYIQFADSVTTLTDMPLAEQALSNQTRAIMVDLRNGDTATATVYVGSTPAPSGGGIRFKYATDADSYSTWTTLCEVEADNDLGTGVQRFGTATAVPAGAKTQTTRIRAYTFGGDGAVDWSVGQIGCVFHGTVPINTGTPTGAQMVAAITAELGSTAWQSGAGSLSDGSVTLAKIVNFATQTAPLRKSAGTGVLEVGTQSDWRTFLDVANTVHGRKGAVVAASGDYTADQITETGSRVFVPPALLAAMTRWNTSTTITTSDVIGLNEAWVSFGGTGSLTLTGTLTNNAAAFFVNIFNTRTVAVNIVAESGRTLKKQDGTVITTYSLPAKQGLCAKVEGTSWVLQV